MNKSVLQLTEKDKCVQQRKTRLEKERTSRVDDQCVLREFYSITALAVGLLSAYREGRVQVRTSKLDAGMGWTRLCSCDVD